MTTLATMHRSMSRRTMGRCLACTAVVGLLASVVAGCGSSGGTPGDGGSGGSGGSAGHGGASGGGGTGVATGEIVWLEDGTSESVPTALADFLATHSDIDVELQERPSHELGAPVGDGHDDLVARALLTRSAYLRSLRIV